MIEIPESITIAKQLNETVKGKKIVQAQTEHTPHGFAFYSGDAEFYSTVMEGLDNPLGLAVWWRWN